MAFFPMLGQGGAAQFPLVRRRRVRRLQAESAGGHRQRALPGEGEVVTWELTYEDVSDSEAAAVESLFLASRGGVDSFTFVDPLSNLLAGSEDLLGPVWARGVSGVAAGGDGPWPDAAVFVVTNGGQAAGGLEQSLALPAGFKYCLSCYAKGGAVGLSIGGVERWFAASAEWQRRQVTVEELGLMESVPAKILAPAGGSVAVCCPQLEAQAAASPYQASVGDGGVYPGTRFAMDALRVTRKGPNRNSLFLILETRVAG
jgi:hypothetical protein